MWRSDCCRWHDVRYADGGVIEDERKTKAQLIMELEDQRHRGMVAQGRERVLEAVTAMRSSGDLLKVVAAVFRLIKGLCPSTISCSIVFVDETSEEVFSYVAADSCPGEGARGAKAPIPSIGTPLRVTPATWRTGPDLRCRTRKRRYNHCVSRHNHAVIAAAGRAWQH